jgi:phosphoribosylformylglycinamidine synthase
MGGAAVSSADTGAFSSGIELNAIQRSNPEMQKSCQCHSWIGRKYETQSYPFTITELEDFKLSFQGGLIDLDKLPVGDPTLSAKEIIGNESQKNVGWWQKDIDTLQKIADRERALCIK